MRFQVIVIAVLALPIGPVRANDVPDPEALEAQDFSIGEVTLEKSDVFDLSNPDEDKWLYRLANRLHLDTRDKTILKQLLFEPGDPYEKRLIEESERILRRNKYLYDADIRETRAEDGKVDLTVATRDVWSLAPELSLSRSGGVTRTRFGLEETNLMGRGQRLRALRDNDIDRSENIIEYADPNIGSKRVSLLARYSDNSDGSARLLSVIRPFYALDTRWAGGGTIFANDRVSKLYRFGEAAAEYQHQRDHSLAFGGWSRGLVDGRAIRWTAGAIYDNNRFLAAPDTTLLTVLPEDRKLVYPFLGFELVEDGFVTTSNRSQIERTEDFQMGLQVRGSLGWADTSFGSDRDAAIFTAAFSRGFGSLEKDALILAAWSSGRVESGELRNGLLSLDARFYRKQSAKRTFFIALAGTAGESLDLDNPVELGGNSGLRGYPLRYQVGDTRLLATIEQRFYTDWYPFRFARVGGAVFADVGRVWGDNPLGPDDRGWLADVGFGFRFALTRIASSKVVHLDLAFPLNDDPDIDEVQILLEARKSF